MIVPLVIWIIVGLLNLIKYISHRKCTWIDYWLAYGALIMMLIDQIVEKLV